MMYVLKVINYLRFNFNPIFSRNFCSNIAITDKSILHQLDNRSLVRVRGDDSFNYLQGLITNDMRHLQEGAGSMFAMFLNTKGRVMYDSIIYNTEDKNSYLIECDTNIISLFQKHLKVYKIRKNVDIEILPDLNVWVLFNNSNYDEMLLKGETDPDKSNANIHPIERKGDVLIYNDPRLHLLGWRMLCPVDVEASYIKESLCIPQVEASLDKRLYRDFRYKLGIAEGTLELPPGNCFPLEANCDYLHGVSFHKGCYIGQELTARTHHTGVVRKRIMPILFDKDATEEIDNETAVFTYSNSTTSVGKIRGKSETSGLGLLRVAQALASPLLQVAGHKAKTFRPNWWPEEVSKEKISSAL